MAKFSLYDIHSENMYNKSLRLDKYSTVQLSFYLYFYKCFPNPFSQYLHKLKVFFVRGVPSLFSTMLHPCNLALHEVKVSSALKIIRSGYIIFLSVFWIHSNFTRNKLSAD